MSKYYNQRLYEGQKKWREKNREKYLRYKKEWARNKWENNKEFREEEIRKEKEKIRKNSEYRKQKNKATKKWIKNNRDRHNQLMKRQYYANKEKWRIRKLSNLSARKKILRSLKGNKCQRCGSKKNLQFHHTSYNLNKNLKGDKLTLELAKITLLLCKNCHFKEHHNISKLI